MNELKQPAEKPATQKEIAAFLSVSRQTLIKLKKNGKVPYFMVGSKIMYQPSKVMEALTSASH